MKTVGIVRNIDHLGRFVIPKELRDRFDIAAGTALAFLTDGDAICSISTSAAVEPSRRSKTILEGLV